MLAARGLTKIYPAADSTQNAITLFRDLELEVFAGEMVAVVGHSGAGKSSLIKLITEDDSIAIGHGLTSGALRNIPCHKRSLMV